MFNNNQAKQRQKGFSLVEMMVAMLVFMVVMLGLCRGEMAVMFANKDNTLRDEAVRLAEDRLSDLKGLQFSKTATAAALLAAAWSAPVTLAVNTRSGSVNFSRCEQVTDLGATGTALKRIDVAVGWNDKEGFVQVAPTNTNHMISLSTIIAQSD